MNIRNATAADIPSILHLERQVSAAAHWSEEQYERLFQPGRAERLVLLAQADVRDEIQGFLVARKVAPEWELENVVVAKSARRNGLGMRLLEALLAKARETDSESVFLEVRESNAAARGLYAKAGFQESGRRKSYYGDPTEDAILCRRGLP